MQRRGGRSVTKIGLLGRLAVTKPIEKIIGMAYRDPVLKTLERGPQLY